MQESDLHTAIMRNKLELESNGIDLGSSSSMAFHVGNTLTSCPAVMVLPSSPGWSHGPHYQLFKPLHTDLAVSKTTNLASLIGMRFFPRTLIRQPTMARMAKATFGTVRVFGIIGRGIPFVAVGLAVFDLVSIGKCAYEVRNGR